MPSLFLLLAATAWHSVPNLHRAAAPVACAASATDGEQLSSDTDEQLSWLVEEQLLLSGPALNAYIVAEVRSLAKATLDAQSQEWREYVKRKPWLAVKSAKEDEAAAAEAAQANAAIDEICRAASAAFTSAHAEGLFAKRKNLHEVLGVDPSAHILDIKSAYKVLARELHPDRHIGATEEELAENERRFQEIGEARDVLCNPDQRRKWGRGETHDAIARKATPHLATFFDTDALKAPLERVDLSVEVVARHVSDMYHNRAFRGSDVEIVPASGAGEAAAREAVGLPPLDDGAALASLGYEENYVDPNECVVWGPNGVCLQTRAEQAAERKRRFEKVQIEGTRTSRALRTKLTLSPVFAQRPRGALDVTCVRAAFVSALLRHRRPRPSLSAHRYSGAASEDTSYVERDTSVLPRSAPSRGASFPRFRNKETGSNIAIGSSMNKNDLDTRAAEPVCSAVSSVRESGRTTSAAFTAHGTRYTVEAYPARRPSPLTCLLYDHRFYS